MERESITKEYICPICNGKFDIYPWQDWQYYYKLKNGNGQRVYVCSYSCMRKYEQTNKKKSSKTNSADNEYRNLKRREYYQRHLEQCRTYQKAYQNTHRSKK